MRIEKITYLDVLANIGNVISLDISVVSTGWVKVTKQDGKVKVEEGTYKIKAKKGIGRVMEFWGFLSELCGEDVWDAVYVEDVIAGENFETTRGLIELNSVIDIMKYKEEVHITEIKKIGNGKWKKWLRELSGYEGEIRSEETKQKVRNCLSLLEYPMEGKAQDICDAMGILMGVGYTEQLQGQVDSSAEVDIRKGWNIARVVSPLESVVKLDIRGKKQKFYLLVNQEINRRKREGEEWDTIYCVLVSVRDLGRWGVKLGVDTLREREVELCIRKKGSAVK